MRPKKKSRERKIVAVALIAIAIIAVYQLYATHQQALYPPTLTSSTSSTTSSYSFSIHQGDLYYTMFRGCWFLNRTDGTIVALFFANVTNRANLPTDYVNVSYYLANLTFSNGVAFAPSSRLNIIAGPFHSVNFRFQFGFGADPSPVKTVGERGRDQFFSTISPSESRINEGSADFLPSVVEYVCSILSCSASVFDVRDLTSEGMSSGPGV